MSPIDIEWINKSLSSIKSKNINLKKLCYISSTFLITLLLIGLPNNPNEIIVTAKRKSQSIKFEELVLPSSELSKTLAINTCNNEFISKVYENNLDTAKISSGLKVFNARLKNNYNGNSHSFKTLSIKVQQNQSVEAQDKSKCLLPLSFSIDSSSAKTLSSSNLSSAKLGAESVSCLNSKAYLKSNKLASKFYLVSQALSDYSKYIDDKKIILELKRDLEKQKSARKALNPKRKAQIAKADIEIRKNSLAITYAQFLSKNASLLGKFYDSVCENRSQANQPNTPVPEIVTAIPTSPAVTTITPQAPTKTATPVAPTRTPTKAPTLTPTIASTIDPSGRIASPNILAPNLATVDANNDSKIELKWSVPSGAVAYLLRVQDLTDANARLANFNNGQIYVYVDSYSSNSFNLPVVEGHSYHFWVHAITANYSNANIKTWSLDHSFDFRVNKPGSNCIGDTTQSCTISNGVGSQSRSCSAAAGFSAWSACTVKNCNSGYKVSGNDCVGDDTGIISQYAIGDRVTMIKPTNVRESGTLSGTLLGTQAIGSFGAIIEGPTRADNIIWWKVNFDNGADGFAGEDNFQKIAAICTNGQTQPRTMWKNSSVSAGQSCVSEAQTWTCTNGDWVRSTGTYTNTSCYVDGAPGQTRCVQQNNSSCFNTITACVNQSAPGDICEVQSGTYPEKIKPSVSGEALRPIKIRAANGANVLVGGLDLDSVFFVEVEGLSFISLTRDVITWRFNTYYLAGTYANGDPWVKGTNGAVTISSFDTMPPEDFPFTITRQCNVVGDAVKVPAFNAGTFLPGYYKCSYVGEWKTGYYGNILPGNVNPGNFEQIPLVSPGTRSDYGGSMLNLNPAPSAPQGLSIVGGLNETTALIYNAALNVAKTLPLTIAVSNSQPVQSLLSTAEPGPLPKSRFSHASILTVVNQAPANRDFRPYYGGPVKATQSWNFNNIDWSVLKNLPTPAGSTPPSVANLIGSLKLLIVEKFGGFSAEPGTQFKSYSNSGMAYGREISSITSQAALYLQTDANRENKAKVLIYLLQYGLDIYGAVQNDMLWFGNGGHNHGRLMPFYMAARCFGMPNSVLSNYANQFQEANQHFYVSHNSVNLPEWQSNRDEAKLYRTWPETGYRFINGGPNSAVTLTMLLMEGSRANIKARFNNHDRIAPLIDYIFDVFYPIETGNPKIAIRNEVPVYGVGNNNNSIQPFTQRMWNAYAGNP